MKNYFKGREGHLSGLTDLLADERTPTNDLACIEQLKETVKTVYSDSRGEFKDHIKFYLYCERAILEDSYEDAVSALNLIYPTFKVVMSFYVPAYKKGTFVKSIVITSNGRFVKEDADMTSQSRAVLYGLFNYLKYDE